MDQPKAFFASLFDFSFETLIAPRIVKILFILSIALAGLWALFLIVGGFSQSPGSGILMLIIGGPLAFFVSVIYARVVLEIVLAIFRISDNLSKMVDITGRAGSGEARHHPPQESPPQDPGHHPHESPPQDPGHHPQPGPQGY
jgi:hypothetical protein